MRQTKFHPRDTPTGKEPYPRPYAHFKDHELVRELKDIAAATRLLAAEAEQAVLYWAGAHNRPFTTIEARACIRVRHQARFLRYAAQEARFRQLEGRLRPKPEDVRPEKENECPAPWFPVGQCGVGADDSTAEGAGEPGALVPEPDRD